MKKFLSAILCAAMTVSAYPAFGAQYTPDDDTVFCVDFDSPLPEGSESYLVTPLDEGVYGKAAWFNRSTSYIKLPDNITKGVTDFTMAAWVKVDPVVDASGIKSVKDWQRVIDLGNGQDNFAFIGFAMGGNVRGSVKNNGGGEEQLTGTALGNANVGKWMHIAMVQEGTTRTLYVNGKAVDSNDNVSYTLDGMGDTTQNYIGRSQYAPDPRLGGYVDEAFLAKRAYSAEEIKALATIDEPEITEELLRSYVDIEGKDSIKENISLVKEVNGASVEWESSDESVVSTKDVQNGDYVIPAGVVTRGDEDKTVTLTATITKGGVTATKDIDVTVKAKPAEQGEMAAYLYAYFRGNVNGEDERLSIHIAASEDGYNWTDLNGNFPILESTMGTGCLRDPYIIRSHDGDRFYLIATDLNTQDGQGWGPWSLAGSKYLMVWESDDLVNWSEQRMIKFADDDIGAAWAPEAVWDDDTKEYLVYASGKDLTLLPEQKDTVYVVRTRDFRTFSEPEIFFDHHDADGSRFAAIDSTIIQADDGRYYQFFKKYNNEIHMMVSDHASGPYEEVKEFTPINGEGPAIYKVNNSENYCLCVDNYSVYIPYLTSDISSGIFTKATDDVTMPTGSKHGGMIPITTEEYAGILEKYGSKTPAEPGSKAEYEWNFEDEDTSALKGNAKVVYSDEKQSNVLSLDGTDGTYFEFPENIFDRQDTFTLSFDVKDNNPKDRDNHMTFAVGQDDQQYYFFKTAPTYYRSAITITSWQYEQAAATGTIEIPEGWAHINLVVEPKKIAIYKNGVKIAENAVDKTISHLGLEGLKAYLGKSMYAADPYYAGEFDNVKLYFRALSDEEIISEYDITDEEAVVEDANFISIGYPFDAVKGDITLPSKGIYGSDITWEISDKGIVSPEGKVTRPTKGEGDFKVTLTATVTKGSAKNVREIVITIPEETEEFLSTADFSTHSFGPAKGDVVITFDFTASEQTDAVIGITGSTNVPNAWNSCGITIRTYNGAFEANDGNSKEGFVTGTVAYEAGKTYKLIVRADTEKKTFSVYVLKDGAIETVAENYAYRSGSQAAEDLGRVVVRGGDGVAAGLFTVSDFRVEPGDTILDNVYFENGKLSCDIISLSEKSGVVTLALYDENGNLKGVQRENIDVETGINAYEAEVDAARVKIMLWNGIETMTPYAESMARRNN